MIYEVTNRSYSPSISVSERCVRRISQSVASEVFPASGEYGGMWPDCFLFVELSMSGALPFSACPPNKVILKLIFPHTFASFSLRSWRIDSALSSIETATPLELAQSVMGESASVADFPIGVPGQTREANVVSQYISNGGWGDFNWASLGWSTLMGAASGALAMSTLGPYAMIAASGALGAIGSIGSHLIAGDDFRAWQTWLDIGLSTGAGLLAGWLGGSGAMHGQDFAAASTSLAKAASSYSRVLSKASSGGYATARGMHIALSRTGNGFVRALNGMHSLVGGAASDLAKSLAVSAFASGGYAFIGGLAAYEW